MSVLIKEILKILSSQKRGGVQRGTNGFASALYTIADVFSYTFKGILSCFKFQKPDYSV
jgi:hypothetical protein